jgi:glucose-1-phosphate cytidylyltransferase
LPLPEQLEAFSRSNAVASFLSVKPNLSYHFLTADDQNVVTSFRDIAQSGLRVNGGFFTFRQEIFNYLKEGEDLVQEPFERLVKERRLMGYPYDGFWVPMDTAKDKAKLDELLSRGVPPWFVWETRPRKPFDRRKR